MKLSQLRYVVEVHRQNNHITDAASILNTSQPGVSKQIRQLEYELGFSIFERKRNRVIGLTEPGREVVKVAQRVINDMQALKHIKDDYTSAEVGQLTIATTHTMARYFLPQIIEKFISLHKDVQISLKQGDPTDICEFVLDGRADMAIGTEIQREFPDLARLPCFSISRSLIAQKGHPILDVENITLADIAKYPVIAHDVNRSGRWRVLEAFESAGLRLNLIFGSVDADVSKTYTELGIGISIIATIAVNAANNTKLGSRDVTHLFDSSVVHLSLRRNTYLRKFDFDFINMVSEALDPNTVRASLKVDAKDTGFHPTSMPKLE